MDIERLLVFAAAYLAVVILPGPSVTALVARVLARGPQGSAAYIAGLVVGALVWFAVAAAGLAALASAFAGVFVAIRYIGAAYLLYLAWKLWTAPPHPLPAASGMDERELGEGRGLFLTGLALNLGNPKAIAFFLALLPSVVPLESIGPLAFAELAAVIAAIASGVLAAYVYLAVRMRRLFSSPRAVRRVNRGSSVAVAGAAVAVATR
jgi:threonine/homoserine/homoserine lactone efflux protein